MTPPFLWRGKNVDATIGSLLDAVTAVSEGEEAAFMAAYAEVNPHAYENVGYLIGYVEPATRRERMWKRFRTCHPVLGSPGAA